MYIIYEHYVMYYVCYIFIYTHMYEVSEHMIAE